MHTVHISCRLRLAVSDLKVRRLEDKVFRHFPPSKRSVKQKTKRSELLKVYCIPAVCLKVMNDTMRVASIIKELPHFVDSSTEIIMHATSEYWR